MLDTFPMSHFIDSLFFVKTSISVEYLINTITDLDVPDSWPFPTLLLSAKCSVYFLFFRAELCV